MAAMSLPEPGTKYGPCEEPCKHKDCAESRAMAATICGICDKPIGYNRGLYEDKEYGGLVHASCLERVIGV